MSAIEGGLGLGVVSHWVADKALALGTIAEVDCGHFPVERPLYAIVGKREPRRAAAALLELMRGQLKA